MDNWITCTLCGTRFDPLTNPSCESCPLHTGCATACCPNCGATNINPSGSRLARWLEARIKGKNHELLHQETPPNRES
ncbi:MAG: hypothetical protein ABFD29_06820 [Anaerolineaceae bacterium]|jgi:hypothetical protein